MEDITLSPILNFNILEIERYPFLSALGYIRDSLSDKIRFPFNSTVFNLKETFVFYGSSSSVIVYQFLQKSFLHVKIKNRILNLHLLPPVNLVLITEFDVILIDLETIENGRYNYQISKKDFVKYTIFDYIEKKPSMISDLAPSISLPSLELPISIYHPLKSQISFTKDNEILLVEWNGEKNIFKYRKAMFTIESLTVLFRIFEDLIRYFHEEESSDD